MTNEQQRQQMARESWLKYFNQTLYEKDLITETDRNRMALKIENSAPKMELRIEQEKQEPFQMMQQL